MTIPKLFTRLEALEILRIGNTTLFELERAGKIKAVRIGRKLLFPESEIERITTLGVKFVKPKPKHKRKKGRLGLLREVS